MTQHSCRLQIGGRLAARCRVCRPEDRLLADLAVAMRLGTLELQMDSISRHTQHSLGIQ